MQSQNNGFGAGRPGRGSFSRDRKRRDAGVVDRAALEMRCTGNCTGGSNPSLSATKGVNQAIAGFTLFFTPNFKGLKIKIHADLKKVKKISLGQHFLLPAITNI